MQKKKNTNKTKIKKTLYTPAQFLPTILAAHTHTACSCFFAARSLLKSAVFSYDDSSANNNYNLTIFQSVRFCCCLCFFSAACCLAFCVVQLFSCLFCNCFCCSSNFFSQIFFRQTTCLQHVGVLHNLFAGVLCCSLLLCQIGRILNEIGVKKNVEIKLLQKILMKNARTEDANCQVVAFTEDKSRVCGCVGAAPLLGQCWWVYKQLATQALCRRLAFTARQIHLINAFVM